MRTSSRLPYYGAALFLLVATGLFGAAILVRAADTSTTTTEQAGTTTSDPARQSATDSNLQDPPSLQMPSGLQMPPGQEPEPADPAVPQDQPATSATDNTTQPSAPTAPRTPAPRKVGTKTAVKTAPAASELAFNFKLPRASSVSAGETLAAISDFSVPLLNVWEPLLTYSPYTFTPLSTKATNILNGAAAACVLFGIALFAGATKARRTRQVIRTAHFSFK